MTNYPYILFNKSPEQLRLLGARAGRAYGRNQRDRRAQMPTPPALDQKSCVDSESQNIERPLFVQTRVRACSTSRVKLRFQVEQRMADGSPLRLCQVRPGRQFPCHFQ